MEWKSVDDGGVVSGWGHTEVTIVRGQLSAHVRALLEFWFVLFACFLRLRCARLVLNTAINIMILLFGALLCRALYVYMYVVRDGHQRKQLSYYATEEHGSWGY